MTKTHTMRFTKPFILLTISLFVLVSCNNYRKITYSKATVFKKKSVAKRINDYDIYVHDDNKIYQLSEVDISEDKLSGIPIEITDSITQSGDTLNDMHLYMDASDRIILTEDVKGFTDENVKGVEMYSKKRQGVIGILFGILMAILILFGVLIVTLIVGLSTSSSDSGGSGGSDSGGSDSGCYIATMSYGSYNAPQVMVLREFRDRFLQKFGAGRAFIAWYYKNSPSFVEKHRGKKWLHTTLRIPLNVLVLILKPFYSGENAKK